MTPLGAPSPDPEDDPTGVRALLSSLPDPGPMPTDLVERIQASLEQERVRRLASVDAAAAYDGADGAVADGTATGRLVARVGAEVASLVPGPHASRDRRGLRVLATVMGAAAAVVLVGVLGTRLIGLGSGSSSSATSGAAGSAAQMETNGSGAVRSPAAPSSGAVTRGTPSPDSGPLHKQPLSAQLMRLRVSTTRYTGAGLAAQAATLVDSAVAGLRPVALTAGTGSGLPLATAAGLRSCMDGLHAEASGGATVDIAYYDGAPAAVLVVAAGGRHTAYAVGRECSRSDPHLLHGATPLN